MIRWAVLVSGEGTNLQNFLDLESTKLKHQTVAFVASQRECQGILRATKAGKPTGIFNFKDSSGESDLLKKLSELQIDRIFLMGFMKILSSQFLSTWKSPIINLHPSLLPAFKGKDAVRQAIDAGEKILGVSLHDVVAEMDSGRILRQISFPLVEGISFEEQMKRVHGFEQKLVRDYLFDLEIEEARRVALRT